ncbi:hypothetical protein HHI36_009829 [Cryptolaemus montrouzieri]|uniref:Arm DNA-binding domain-containing protein n=1 Tax=Cryptolaemus montrouzieri TaxID=559131 RepID=A0ABD2MGZ2_9CUCU
MENTTSETFEAHLSDHKGQVIQCNLYIDIAPENKEKITVRCINEKNKTELKAKLKDEKWNSINTDQTAKEAFDKFWYRLLEILDTTCPIKTVTKLKRNLKKKLIRIRR